MYVKTKKPGIQSLMPAVPGFVFLKNDLFFISCFLLVTFGSFYSQNQG